MIAKIAFQVIQTTEKDWEIEGRKGTSHKAQLLIDNAGLPSTLTVKRDPKVTLERGKHYVGVVEISDANPGYKVLLTEAEPKK